MRQQPQLQTAVDSESIVLVSDCLVVSAQVSRKRWLKIQDERWQWVCTATHLDLGIVRRKQHTACKNMNKSIHVSPHIHVACDPGC